MIAIFQPHLFTRTRDFAEAFGEALNAADAAWVLPIYPARETPIAGVTSALITAAAPRIRLFDGAVTELPAALRPMLKSGDVCIFMGAGNIDEAARALLAQLRGEK